MHWNYTLLPKLDILGFCSITLGGCWLPTFSLGRHLGDNHGTFRQGSNVQDIVAPESAKETCEAHCAGQPAPGKCRSIPQASFSPDEHLAKVSCKLAFDILVSVRQLCETGGTRLMKRCCGALTWRAWLDGLASAEQFPLRTCTFMYESVDTRMPAEGRETRAT